MTAPADDDDRTDGSSRRNGAPQDEAPDDWRKRSRLLEERLRKQRGRIAPDTPGRNTSGGFQGMAEGLKIASEFVAGILVGIGIGYLLDLMAGTSPFGLIVFLLIGFAAGVLNVLRSVSRTGPPSGPPGPGAQG